MRDAPEPDGLQRVDLGCGSAKRPGFIGLDCIDLPGVDHVLDLTTEPLPFADRSVDEVYSAHFLEHVKEPNNIIRELGRVCRDGAHIEFWTPYAFSNEAFLYGHEAFLTETVWYHFCVSHRDVFVDMLQGRWQLESVTFVIKPDVHEELDSHGVPLDFAVKYHKGVVEEFGVKIRFRTDLAAPVIDPVRLWAHGRFGDAHVLASGAPAAYQQTRTLGARLRRRIPERVKPALRALRGS
jgi:SAM-dependent methyltransferase